MPTAISITPTACISAAAPPGTKPATHGETYFSHAVSMLRNLSAPAAHAMKPHVIRSGHQICFRSELVICENLRPNGVARLPRVTDIFPVTFG